MKKNFSILGVILFSTNYAQTTYKLDSIDWIIQQPEIYQNYATETNLFFLRKDSIQAVNTMEALFSENENMNALTPEVFAYFLKDSFEKTFNNDFFTGETSVAKQFIDQQKFYVISVSVGLKEEEYSFIYKYYFTEINHKLLSIIVSYDNDDDKKLIEDALFNSKFK